MELIVTQDYQGMAIETARLLAKEILKKPDIVLGLATGSTPEKVYKKLIEFYQKEILSFDKITSFNLDEYLGLSKAHEQSYYYYMMDKFFHHIDINMDRINILDGKALNIEQECKDFEEKIRKAGGIDLQLLGIGHNGHIGFNEPSEDIEPDTRVVNLTEETIEANSRFFDSIEEVPNKAITMGMKTIMNARKIILIANGEDKAEAIFDTVRGPIDPKHPGSILQLHCNATVIVDKDAAKLL
ncbi:MAG: glucosamine-6-phosphate deaminase [Andreesenia angusta]|nr:glucosamine-6-phosphate deaminase [Andreesenia angusta]